MIEAKPFLKLRHLHQHNPQRNVSEFAMTIISYWCWAGSGLTCSRLASADDLWWHSKLHQFGIHAKSPASDPACDDSFGEFPLVAFGVSIVQSLPHVAESQNAITGWEDFGCAMQDLVLSVISLIIIALSYHGFWCFVVFYILPLSNSFIVECKPIWLGVQDWSLWCRTCNSRLASVGIKLPQLAM